MRGSEIRKLRKGLAKVIKPKSGVVSQQALAEMIGASKRSVAYWESGEKSPHPMFIEKLQELRDLLPAGTR